MPRLPPFAALLLAATSSFAQANPPASRDPLASGVLAVLEFTSGLKAADREQIDPGYLADVVRGAAKRALPRAQIMTRENLISMLQAQGKKLEECVGECEVETGRLIQADLVISGNLHKVGPNRLTLNLKLHETRGGALIAQATARGQTAEALDDAVEKTTLELLAPLMPKAQARSPQVSIGQSQALPDVPALAGQLQQGGAVDLDVDPDVLVAYDRARSADERGKEKPEDAANAWKAVAALSGKNPYKAEAAQRQKQWEEFAQKKRAFEGQLASDTDKLRKVLPLRTVAEPLKIELLTRYARLYGDAAARPFLAQIQAGPARQHAEAALGCEAKDAAKCSSMAELAESSGDAPRAVGYLERACEAGAATACEKLGVWWTAGGPGVDKDMARGMAMLDRACSAGRATGCARLAGLYEAGADVKGDMARALPLREKACTGGDGESCYRLSAAYEAGTAVARDDAKALALLRQACNLRHRTACERVTEIDRREAAARAERKRIADAKKAEQDRLADIARKKRIAAEAVARQKQAELEAARKSARTRRTAGYVIGGLGVLSGGGATLFALNSASTNDKVKAGGFSTAREIQQALDAGKTQNKLATILAVGAGVALATGVVLVITAKDPQPTAELSVAPGALRFAWRFP